MTQFRVQSNNIILQKGEGRNYIGCNSEERQEFTNLCIQIELGEVRGCGKFGYQNNFGFKLIEKVFIGTPDKTLELSISGEELLSNFIEVNGGNKLLSPYLGNTKTNLTVEYKKEEDSILKRKTLVTIPIISTYLNNLADLPSLLKNKPIEISVTLRDIRSYIVYDHIMEKYVEDLEKQIIRGVRFLYDSITHPQSQTLIHTEKIPFHLTKISKDTFNQEKLSLKMDRISSISTIARFKELTENNNKVLFYPEVPDKTEAEQFLDNIKNSLLILIPKNSKPETLEEYIKTNFPNCNKSDFTLVTNGRARVKKNFLVKVTCLGCKDFDIYYHNNILSFNRNESELPSTNVSEFIKEIKFIRMDNGEISFIDIVHNIPDYFIHTPLDIWTNKFNTGGKDKRSREDQNKYLFYKNPYHYGMGSHSLISNLLVQQGVSKIYFNNPYSTDKMFRNTSIYTSNNVTRGEYIDIMSPIVNFNNKSILGISMPSYIEKQNTDNCDKIIISIEKEKDILKCNSPLNIMNIVYDIYIESPTLVV